LIALCSAAVILEDAAQVGSSEIKLSTARRSRRGSDLDDHEPAGSLDGTAREKTAWNLKRHHGEADRTREREDQGSRESSVEGSSPSLPPSCAA